MTFKTEYEDHPFVAPVLSVPNVSVSAVTTVATIATPEVEPIVLPKTWDDIRAERDALLAGCDWCLLADAPIIEDMRTAMIAYRQELRDITKTYSDPVRVMYPLSPLDRAAMIKKYNIVIGVRTDAPNEWAMDANAQSNAATVSNTTSNSTTTTN